MTLGASNPNPSPNPNLTPTLTLTLTLTRSLFVADGMPAHRVFEALAANKEDRASDILLIVERQSMRGVDGLRLGGGPDAEPDSALFPWL